MTAQATASKPYEAPGPRHQALSKTLFEGCGQWLVAPHLRLDHVLRVAARQGELGALIVVFLIQVAPAELEFGEGEGAVVGVEHSVEHSGRGVSH